MLKAVKNDFEKIYYILKEAFPPTERRTKKEQLKLFNNKHYRVYIDDKDVRIFICTWEFDKFIFIEHFAVAKEFRGKKLGSTFLKKFYSSTNKPVIFEVEPPENDISEKRIRFYQRHGATLNSFDYIQPPMQRGQPPIPLMIMSYPEQINKAEFEIYKKEIHSEVYNVKEQSL